MQEQTEPPTERQKEEIRIRVEHWDTLMNEVGKDEDVQVRGPEEPEKKANWKMFAIRDNNRISEPPNVFPLGTLNNHTAQEAMSWARILVNATPHLNGAYEYSGIRGATRVMIEEVSNDS